MQQKDIELLLKKHQSGEATPEEIAFLESWYAHWNEKIPPFITPEQLAEDLQLISLNIEPLNEISRQPKLWPAMIAAAAILLIISAGAYFLHESTPQKQVAQIQPQVIVPGHNQATLTLANGKKIVLSKGLSGKLAQQGNTQISVNGASEVVYTGSDEYAEVEYNTLSTTKGEQSPYPLVLADGTKVWLNSNSAIIFPTAFNGNSRQVKIIGEAYFEVAHNSSKPFTVKAGNQIVEDIGTAFNINSYEDEPAIKTTLVEGSVRVTANGDAKVLKPGQRSVVTKSSIFTQESDSEAETAWVGGRFIFHDEELHSVMRQLARWYNIEVIYDDNPNNVSIDGRFSKSRNISQILKAFVQTGAVKFKIKGTVVHVTE